MGRVSTHLQQKLFAGVLAAIPLAVTAFILWYVDSRIRALFPELEAYPAVGIVVAILVIYLLGVFVTSLVGRWLLAIIDWVIARIPGLRSLYTTWKQVALTPGGSEGIFSRVVLVEDETGVMRMLGLTSGEGIPGAPDVLCVYVPGAPNPTTGRLFFVPSAACRFLDIGAKEALKFIVSGGNYVPAPVGAALSRAPSASTR